MRQEHQKFMVILGLTVIQSQLRTNKTLCSKAGKWERSVVAHTFNPSTQEADSLSSRVSNALIPKLF